VPLIYRIFTGARDTVIAVLDFVSKGLGILNLSLSSSNYQVFLGIIFFAFSDYVVVIEIPDGQERK
jgi:hypothetical protein